MNFRIAQLSLVHIETLSRVVHIEAGRVSHYRFEKGGGGGGGDASPCSRRVGYYGRRAVVRRCWSELGRLYKYKQRIKEMYVSASQVAPSMFLPHSRNLKSALGTSAHRANAADLSSSVAH